MAWNVWALVRTKQSDGGRAPMITPEPVRKRSPFCSRTTGTEDRRTRSSPSRSADRSADRPKEPGTQPAPSPLAPRATITTLAHHFHPFHALRIQIPRGQLPFVAIATVLHGRGYRHSASAGCHGLVGASPDSASVIRSQPIVAGGPAPTSSPLAQALPLQGTRERGPAAVGARGGPRNTNQEVGPMKKWLALVAAVVVFGSLVGATSAQTQAPAPSTPKPAAPATPYSSAPAGMEKSIEGKIKSVDP